MLDAVGLGVALAAQPVEERLERTDAVLDATGQQGPLGGRAAVGVVPFPLLLQVGDLGAHLPLTDVPDERRPFARDEETLEHPQLVVVPAHRVGRLARGAVDPTVTSV